MQNDPERRSRLDRKTTPIAILHAGMFVYANPAFLRLLGYRHYPDIEGIPVLDMVDKAFHDSIRKHFVKAAGVTLDAPSLPTARLKMLRNKAGRLGVTMSSCSTTFEGEPCIEIWLRDRHGMDFRRKRWHAPRELFTSLVILIVLLLAPLTILHKLNINNAPAVYFPDDDPAIVIDRALREKFPNDQVYILLFEGVALYSDGFLNAYHELATKLQRHPLVDKVFGVTTQDHIAGNADGFFVEPLIDVKALENTRPAQRRQRATTDRFAKDALVSRDGSALSLVVAPVAMDNSIERLKLEDEILSAVKEVRLDTYLTGRTGFIPLDIAELRSMLRDNIIFIPATVITGLFLVWWLFRRWLAVVMAGISISIIVHSTMSLYVLAGQPFTLLSSIAPPLLSALTLAALVHFYSALNYAARRGLTGPERVEHALGEVRQPALFTALTTAAGLTSLAASPIPAIRTFGLISAAGVLLIYFLVMIILPPVFTQWDSGTWPFKKAGLRWMDRVVRRLYSLGVRYPVWIVVLTVIGLGAGVPALWKVKAETNLHEFFLPEHPVRVDTLYFESKFIGTGSLDVVLEAQQRDELKNPEYLSFMSTFQSWVENFPEVDKTISPADFIEEMHWGFNAEEPALRRIPDDANLISQYLFIYDGEDLFDFVDRDFRTSRISLSINIHSANEISSLIRKISIYLDKRTPAGLKWEIAGNSRLFAEMEDLLVTGQVYSLCWALGLIFLLMLYLWRSVGSALLCMIPNMSPILMIFIIMGIFGIWLDMATAMIASVAVGIAVDDTIHVYHGYSKRLKAGIQPVLAMARTFRQAGRAVMTTTIILSAQFMILVLSLFQPTKHFGFLTSIGLWTALVFDLILLPALLVLIANYRKKSSGTMSR